jgi:hypothetical protein
MHFDPTKPLADLIMKHAGSRICVMGGSKSLDSDIEQVDADVWISVNDHGAKRREVDYIVCMDNIHTGNKAEMRHFLRRYSNAPVISPWHWGQYQMHKWPGFPKLYNSGIMASWVAYLMGAHPVILAGFDCYGGDRRIMDMHKDYMPHIKSQVRAVSGPLQKFYPAYDAQEKFKPFVVPEIFGPAKDGYIKVRIVKPFEYRGYSWPINTVITVPEFEVRRQIKHKSLEVVA